MPKKTSSSHKRVRRDSERDLDIEIGFLEGVIRRDPAYVEALQVLGDDYTKRGKFVEGLKVDEQLTKLRPDDALAHYNLACSYSLTKRFDESFAALHRALDLGYRDFKWMTRDPDLKNLRAQPAYKLIRERIKTIRTAAD